MKRTNNNNLNENAKKKSLATEPFSERLSESEWVQNKLYGISEATDGIVYGRAAVAFAAAAATFVQNSHVTAEKRENYFN